MRRCSSAWRTRRDHGLNSKLEASSKDNPFPRERGGVFHWAGKPLSGLAGSGKQPTPNAVDGTGVTPDKFGVAPNFVGRDGLLVDECPCNSRPLANASGRDDRKNRLETRATHSPSDSHRRSLGAIVYFIALVAAAFIC
jgi:hypothetical protein